MRLKRQYRAMASDGATIDPDALTAEFSFSSELPVERFYGNEVLDHSPGSADLSRVKDGAPLLWNHDPGQVIGVVESAKIGDDKRGYAKVRFSKSARGQEILQDIKDGILRNVSFGYQINQMEETRGGKNEPSTFTAKSWMPYEISIVSIPADNSVGFGRASDDLENEVEILNQEIINEVTQPTNQNQIEESRKMENDQQKAVDLKVKEVLEGERARNATIDALETKYGHKDLARQLREGGKSIDEARAAYLEKLGAVQKPVVENEGFIEFTDKEKRAYSIVRALNAQVQGNWKDAGFEREVSNEIGKRMNKQTEGFFMPLNMSMSALRAGTAGSYQAGSATLGGNVVATQLMPDMFIDLLRNKTIVNEMGARTLAGLVGNVAIPKQTAAAVLSWVSELADGSETEGTFGQVTMSPKTAIARSQMSRQLLLQSTPDIEMLVRNDLAAVIALGLDLAAINGSGSSGQPRGILNQSGIGSVAMGTNGAAFTSGAAAGNGIDPLIDLETLVATANADIGTLGYITNAKQIGVLKKLKATTGEYLWNGYDSAVAKGVPGEINGYRVGRSNQVPSTLTKGSASGICSAAIFGNFADLLLGMWGGVEILANPYGAGFNNGGVDIRAMVSCDVAVRNAVSFAAITDLL